LSDFDAELNAQLDAYTQEDESRGQK